ncbi:MAG TPA: 1-deoxy-D-xylulose-5-phosphate synthase N-terminal domain-containing protein, partial [bacterium]|nr:1-deoxy-D-xylulose-5-phosphate synthase N-terminal domain-containing protein [bacterium]
MLEHIRNASPEELAKLAAETRELIIETCSRNGGHLAPSLGTVELTLALLKVFDLDRDRIVWDVGHQSYAYKILTDRKARFHTLRTMGGISGFPKRSESPYDVFGTGHGGTSISAALGIKEAIKAAGGDGKVIAVIGDGSMTNGLAFEGMNNIESWGRNTLTVLNDNDMFISTSVGGLSHWFSRKLTGPAYAGLR